LIANEIDKLFFRKTTNYQKITYRKILELN